ncbi:MAG: cyclopropane-fatty-acyl-phospholipid synthase family protein [Hyphomicrobiaceae bacterium]|nr:cyclopropane-fatty-acyl-phospholipid synthase family protein [Hyphomicrobiaceae bacterium]
MGRIIADLASRLDLDASVRLWDGSRHALGRTVTSPLEIVISGPGVLGALIRSPTLDTLIRHYVDRRIDIQGGSLIDLGRQVNRGGRSVKLAAGQVAGLASRLTPFLFEPAAPVPDQGGFAGDHVGRRERARDNKAYIAFHYDLSNDFYRLFLCPEMVYTCAYYHHWEQDLASAQVNKLDMVCRKLRLAPGERFLDIGSGWGALVCHAARVYGVKAHGITLSEEQLAFARDKVKRLGLEDRVTFELVDYINATGTYDKIASVGMYEAIGLANIPKYMGKVRSLLSEDGLFLNHAISRRAKRPGGFLPERLRPEQRALAKYIFPGGALDDIGNTVQAMERAGFEVHDVEGWRMHYARTCRLWHDRLVARKDDGVRIVGEAKYRIYVAYLAGCAIAFERGTARLFQTLASKTAKRPPNLPPTRADLYR